MGNNGQQLTIYLPAGTGKVRVAGTNQNNQQAIWDGVATQNWQGPYFVVATVDWWWKGRCKSGTTTARELLTTEERPHSNYVVGYRSHS